MMHRRSAVRIIINAVLKYRVRVCLFQGRVHIELVVITTMKLAKSEAVDGDEREREMTNISFSSLSLGLSLFGEQNGTDMYTKGEYIHCEKGKIHTHTDTVQAV